MAMEIEAVITKGCMKGLLLLLTASVIGWFGCAVPMDRCETIGIGPTTPLGRIQCLDRKLVELGLTKVSEIQAELPGEIGPEKLLSSTYARPGSRGANESISLFLDSSGRLRAVTGRYFLLSEARGANAALVAKFLAAYWKETVGGEPVFAQRFISKSPANPAGVEQFALAARGSVYGRWTKGASFAMILVCDKLVSISSEQIIQEQRAQAERTFNGQNISHWKSVLLGSFNAEERRQAAQVLAHFGEEAVPSLLDALHDTDGNVRGLAQRSLIRIGAVGIPKLRLAFDDADSTAALLAAEAVVKIGKESVPVLVELVKGGYTDSWNRMLSVLHVMVPEARAVAVSELGQLLQDSDNEVVERAWSAMSQMGPEMKMGRAFFIQALGGEPRVRQKSKGLLMRNGEMGVAVLMESLQHPNGEIRLEAAKTLANFDKRRLEGVLPELSQLCDRDPEQSVRTEVCKVAQGGR